MYYDLYDVLFIYPVLWIISFIAAPIVAAAKKRNPLLWFLLSLVGGPFALLILAFLPREEGSPGKDEDNVSELRAELERTKGRLFDLSMRVKEIERKLGQKAPEKGISPEEPLEEKPIPPKPETPATTPFEPAPSAAVPIEAKEETEKHPDLEQKMGRYWLNRIGILVLATGIAFLISYTFKYFGPFAKILTGYLAASTLFVFGIKLEKKDRFVYYGRSLLGGAWAIAYFTTYAMYHFQASRVIDNQFIDLVLLGAVAIAMLFHTLRYKSQELSAIALFVGYFTATLGDINYFTLMSCLLLAVISVILVYKMRWLRLIFVGIALTYLTHIFWVVKQVRISFVPVGKLDVGEIQFWLSNGFLFLYWLVFTVSIYLIKNQDEKEKKQLAVANFSNFLPFFVLAYSRMYIQYPDFKFPFVMGLGIVYALLAVVSSGIKNRALSTVNTLIALSLITFSVPLKAVPLSTTVIWLVELPFILYIGQRFDKTSFRVFGLLLAAVVFVRVVTLDFAISKTLTVFGHDFTWKNLIFFIGALSSYFSVFIARRIKDEARFRGEKFLVNAYSFFGTIYLTTFLWDTVSEAWLGTVLFEEVFVLALVSSWLKDKSFSLYSYILLVPAAVVLFFSGSHNFIWILLQLPLLMTFGFRYYTQPLRIVILVSGIVLFIKTVMFDERFYYTIEFLQNKVTWREAVLFAGLASMFICYCLNRRFGQREQFKSEYPLGKVYSALGTAYLTFFLWDVVPLRWLSLAWAFEMAGLFFAACKIKDASLRAYSLVLLAMVSIRMVFIDGRWGFTHMSWIVFAVEMACYSAVYFLYKGLKKRNEIAEPEKHLSTTVFIIGAIVATAMIFMMAEKNFMTLAFGVEGAVMFAIGFIARDRLFRLGGFGVFALVLLRIVIIDMAHVAVIYKIISFMILGAIFLITSFLYNRYNVDKDK